MADQSAQPNQDATAEPVKLGKHVAIDPAQPLPALASGPALAFAARDATRASTELFALIAADDAPPRAEMVKAMSMVQHAGILRVSEAGVVDWPLEGRRRYAVVLERPKGPRLLTNLDALSEPVGYDLAIRTVLVSATSILAELSQRGIFHGGVRPTNMFYTADSAGIVLGDCLSTPPSFLQPCLFEPVERAMANPLGRGAGTSADDMYALGVTLLVLLRGSNPSRMHSDDELIDARIERGSYAALVGPAKIPTALVEPLRGLLSDDPKQRWTAGDLAAWLAGQRLSPKSHQATSRNASRPFTFGGRDYTSTRALARAFSAAVPEAAAAIEAGELERWLRMSVSDTSSADQLNSAIAVSAASGGGGDAQARLVTRVCIALDPAAPIRYKDQALTPTGVGPTLAVAMASGTAVQEVADLIAHQFPVFWYNHQRDSRPEYVPLAKEFGQRRTLLARKDNGAGIERCLYELSLSARCLSPLVEAAYAQTAGSLLPALEKAASAPNRPPAPMDRHLAAFLTARDRSIGEGMLRLVTEDADPSERAVALLNLYGTLQDRHGPKQLPQLCAWIATLVEPALRKFHGKALRDRLKLQLKEASNKGNISALQQLVDDARVIREDKDQFETAKAEHGAIERHLERLRKVIAEPKKIEHSQGREIAGICSALLSIIVVAGIVVMNLISPGLGL